MNFIYNIAKTTEASYMKDIVFEIKILRNDGTNL
jgi:hypothetical protein